MHTKSFDGVESLADADAATYAAARAYLPEIRLEGEQLVGANREKQLSFFSTEMDVLANNDLAKCILAAILSDCEKTVDAINLAVRWRDPDIIRFQLDESREVDASGISKALQNALIGRDSSIVATLILYNSKAERVSLRKLVDSLAGQPGQALSEGAATGADPRLKGQRPNEAYVWGGGHGWFKKGSGPFSRLGARLPRIANSISPGACSSVHPASGAAVLAARLPPFVRGWCVQLIRAPASRGWRRMCLCMISP